VDQNNVPHFMTYALSLRFLLLKYPHLLLDILNVSSCNANAYNKFS
jgi:hypothetical protein